MLSEYPYNEKDLPGLVAESNETAFRQLVKSYHNRLATYVLSMTGSRPLTEEVVQDIFLKVWQLRAQLSGISRFDSWLFVIARNHTYNTLTQIARERKRREKWEQEVLASGELVDDSHHSTSSPDRYNALLEEAIRQLPPQQRNIYLLSRRQGLSSAAIREQTGLSIDTIKKHRSLAVKNIKAYLQKYLSFFFL